MKGMNWMAFGMVSALTLCCAGQSFADESKTDKLLELLKSKGVISEGDVAGVKEGDSPGGITIGGTVEAALQYVTHSDPENPDADSTSDLYLATMELVVAAELNDSASVSVVLLAEDIGAGGSDNPAVDEAIITINKLGDTPMYLVGGKRAIPFGQFFTHTISDPVSLEAYEVNTPSLTLGFAADKIMGLDTSLTLYKGEDMMNQIKEMGATFTRDQSTADETDDVNSYVISVVISPAEGMSFGAGYASEPGYDERNNTANVFAEISFGKFTFDAEYFKAAKRETIGGIENKDSALAIGVAAQVNDPLEIALRYETFDNDRSTPEATDIDYNLVLGVNYGLMENIDLLFEVRCLNTEAGTDTTYEERIHEMNVMLSAGF